jgi:UDP-2,3-diacylglucosamine pyrophosphatase LpxH
MLIFIGDVHGELGELTNKLGKYNINNSTFIQVGDFGVGFKNKENETTELIELNDCLKTNGNLMYVIRGNHDNPAYFDGNFSYSNLIFLKDYSLLEIDGRKILLVGGAISIDRSIRKLNVNYWDKEAFIFRELKLKSALSGIDKLDIVVTHSCPGEFEPVELNSLVMSYGMRDNGLITELKKERGALSMLMYTLIGLKLKPAHWYYGHFHYSFNNNYKGLKYHLLNCSEFYEHQ